MEAILQKILNNIEIVIAIVTSIGVLVGVAIAEYRKIKALLAKEQLLTAVTPLLTQAETEPAKLLHTIVNKPLLDSVASNDGKNSIVVQALLEKEPKLLKKAKLTDALQIANWVSGAYQIVKPIIKGLKK